MAIRYSILTILYMSAALAGCNTPAVGDTTEQTTVESPVLGEFAWQTGAPILKTDAFGIAEWISIKDPSLVRFQDRWHLFCTLRGRSRSHAMVYSSFDTFEELAQIRPLVLPNHSGYFCAPQVFFFRPQSTWYMVCQAKSDEWEPTYQAAFATTTDIADPDSWSALKPMGVGKPEDNGYLDFWVICDEQKAYMFFTSDNGNMWREETSLENFPYGWSDPELAYQGDIFEASHIYKLVEEDLYLNLIEARLSEDRRYFKAYTAEKLDGEWKPLAADSANAFASMVNVVQTGSEWTNSVSHGELIRTGYDERMEASLPAPFIFQGVLHSERKGKKYGDIPWDLGILEPIDP